ncbi:hypothetical protein BpHYR1_009284 [Brachionus plicatilis]|uniref:Uncharacterized protein n=1 Tax=Brachionus plicatilis TaxID=10195 RepID=A0A3M7T295_BRAPC|nr:hypothetical protein BpHYR1_009284 [Brachionus plicatilis]
MEQFLKLIEISVLKIRKKLIQLSKFKILTFIIEWHFYALINPIYYSDKFEKKELIEMHEFISQWVVET